MKIKHLFLLTLMLCGGIASAQKKISLEANYPVPMGSNFFKDDYRGVGDVGFKWAFVSLPVVRFGVGANAGYYESKGDDSPDFDKVYVFQPKAFAEFSFEPLVSLHPSVGLGYSIMAFNGGGEHETRNGLNYNVGLAYDIIGGFFVQVQYDLIDLQQKDGNSDSVGLLKAGVGIRF